MSSQHHGDHDLTLVRELVYLLGQVRKRSAGTFKAELAAKGENWIKWVLLAHLSEDGPCSQRDLSDATSMDPSVISRMLEEAEDEGLIKRHRDPDDRRKSVVELLEMGKKRFEKNLELVLPLFDRMLSPLTRKERVTFVELYRKLAHGPMDAAPEQPTAEHAAAPGAPHSHRVRVRTPR